MKWKRIFKNKRTAPLFLLAGVLVLAGLSKGLVARYVQEQKQSEKMAAKNFYFTSDLLSKDGKSYTLSSDTTELTVEVRNYEDALRWADMDINYNYEVSKGGQVVTNGTDVIAQNNESSTTNQITVDNLSAGTYQIKATATSPFSKELKATFVIPEAGTEIQTSISDTSGDTYVLVNVMTGNYTGNVKLNWPAGLIPDATQDAFSNIQTYASGSYNAGNTTIEVQANSSYVFRFFKKDITKDYSNTSQITAEKETD